MSSSSCCLCGEQASVYCENDRAFFCPSHDLEVGAAGARADPRWALPALPPRGRTRCWPQGRAHSAMAPFNPLQVHATLPLKHNRQPVIHGCAPAAPAAQEVPAAPTAFTFEAVPQLPEASAMPTNKAFEVGRGAGSDLGGRAGGRQGCMAPTRRPGGRARAVRRVGRPGVLMSARADSCAPG
jgi:hypothetical protein